MASPRLCVCASMHVGSNANLEDFLRLQRCSGVAFVALSDARALHNRKHAEAAAAEWARRPWERSGFLKLFDTDEMDGAPGDYTQGIPQVLTLLNDSAMHKPNRLVQQIVGEKGEPAEIVTRLYVAVLSRRPREEELEVAREFVVERKGTTEAYQAVWWALVNSPEFAVVP